MGFYLDGENARIDTIKDRRALIGKAVRYLRPCDIDKSGRGYFFPRFDIVAAAEGRQIIFESGVAVSKSDLVEIQVVDPSRPNTP